MQCEQVEMRLAQLVYGELPDDEKAEVLAHLAECPKCAEALGDMRVASRFLEEAVTRGPAPSLSPERRATLLSRPEPARGRRAWLLRMPQIRLAATVAALLLIAVGAVSMLLPGMSIRGASEPKYASTDKLPGGTEADWVTTDAGGTVEFFSVPEGGQKAATGDSFADGHVGWDGDRQGEGRAAGRDDDGDKAPKAVRGRYDRRSARTPARRPQEPGQDLPEAKLRTEAEKGKTTGRTLYAEDDKRRKNGQTGDSYRQKRQKRDASKPGFVGSVRTADKERAYDLWSRGPGRGGRDGRSADDINNWRLHGGKGTAKRPAPHTGKKTGSTDLPTASAVPPPRPDGSLRSVRKTKEAVREETVRVQGTVTDEATRETATGQTLRGGEKAGKDIPPKAPRPVTGPIPADEKPDPNATLARNARGEDGGMAYAGKKEGRTGEGESREGTEHRPGKETLASELGKRLAATKMELESVTRETAMLEQAITALENERGRESEKAKSPPRVLYGDRDELEGKPDGEKLAHLQRRLQEKKAILKDYENSLQQFKSVVRKPKLVAESPRGQTPQEKPVRATPPEKPGDAEEQGEGPAHALPPSSSFRLLPVNPFVLTQKDRFSTFALDVDTASYALAANYIRRGYRPPPGAIRIEEFVNAFDYNYTRQSRRVFSVHASAMPSPFGPRGRDLVLLKVGVRGRVLGREGRKPAHVVFVVDASGSMARSDRMPLVQYAVSQFVGKLDRGDRVSLVTFGTGANLLLERVEVSGGRKRIAKAVETIQCGGSTNLLDGLRVAYGVARRGFATGAINRIVLCSDGVANVGLTDAASMLGEVASLRRQGITFTSAGFGIGAYNDALLEKLANRGDGSYVYVGSRRDARRVFAEEMSATLQTIARDAKIQVAFDPARVRRYRLIGYENRDIADKDFRNDAVDAGEVGSGQSATALYELELRRGDWGAVQGDLGTVYVRYEDLRSGKVEEVSRRLEGALIARRSVRQAPRFHLAACAAEFAEVLRESEHARDGDLNAVRHVLEEVSRELPLDRGVRELLYLVTRARGLPKAP